MSINPGEFKQRLSFQYLSDEKDEDGFPITEPIPYTKAWAKLKTLKGSTFYAAAQNNMQHNREFTIRYQRKLDDQERPENLQVKWKNRTHDIESIENDDGLNITMTVVAKLVT